MWRHDAMPCGMNVEQTSIENATPREDKNLDLGDHSSETKSAWPTPYINDNASAARRPLVRSKCRTHHRIGHHELFLDGDRLCCTPKCKPNDEEYRKISVFIPCASLYDTKRARIEKLKLAGRRPATTNSQKRYHEKKGGLVCWGCPPSRWPETNSENSEIQNAVE